MSGTHTKIRRKRSISDKRLVSVKAFEGGNQNVIITDMAIRNTRIGGFKKVDTNHYFDPTENKIKEYNHNKIRSAKSVKRSMNKLKVMLENYFSGATNEVFITLTTVEEIVDVKKMKQYFKSYWNEVKKFYGKNLVYAYVLEMQQERKSLHIHCIIKDLKRKKLYIPNHINEAMWAKGTTRVTRITDRLDIDFELDEETAMSDPKSFVAKQKVCAIDKVISYMIKYRTKESITRGARLYETSPSLKKPKNLPEIEYGDLKKVLLKNGHTYKNGSTLSIIDDDSSKSINEITKENWSKSR